MKTLTVVLALFLTTFSHIHAQEGWGEIQKLVPDDRVAGQEFGWDMDMDGDYAVIGTNFAPSGNDTYIYKRDSDGIWNQVAHLQSPDFNNFDAFGSAVAMSGNVVMVGASQHDYDANDQNFLSSPGAVYVFEKDDAGAWNFTQKLTALNRVAGDKFGYTIDLDGDRAIIGVWVQQTDENGENPIVSAGAAYIFEQDDAGTWSQAQKIVASDRAAYDYFGRNGIAISGDYAVVGAQYEDQNALGQDTLSSAGSAYIFKRDATGTWSEVQKIVGSERDQGEWFGHAAAMEGETIVVGANQAYVPPNNDINTKHGAAYIFELDENDVWVETQILVGSISIAYDEFGASLGIDGDRLIAGVPGRRYSPDGVHIPGTGGAYIFEKDETDVWNQLQFVHGLDDGFGSYFGSAVAISGDIALGGAHLQDNDENGANDLNNAGAVYVFDANADPLLSSYDCPYLQANYGDACDDGDETTENDVLDSDCDCVGTSIYDCPQLALNFGDPCDDNNPNTENDVISTSCGCYGTSTFDCPALSANIGDSCDDNDPTTTNDQITSDCECAGTIVYDCSDLSANIGDSCDDNNPNTENDVITADCECVGTLVYDCPDLSANIGDSCDDGNENTVGDAITENCECAGTLTYDCEDLQANIGESCDDNNPNTENDVITADCECVGTLVYDCPALSANIGDSCDDNDPATTNDQITSDCECAGIPVNPSDCQDFMYYLADYIPNSGTTIYEVTLSNGIATLEYLVYVNDEVHLAYNNMNNTLYVVSKLLNQYSSFNPHNESQYLSAPVSLPGSVGQVTGAACSPNGDLYISSQSTNSIYNVNLSDGTVSVADEYSPITGGDIAFDSEGNAYMATNASGGGLYQTIMVDNLLTALSGSSTGLAITDMGQLLLSQKDSSDLSVWNTDGTSAGSYALMYNDNPFTLSYGDMTSGCNTYEAPELGSCLGVRTFYAQLSDDGIETDFYEVNFSGNDALLTHLFTMPFNASIGYNATDEVLYLVSKTGYTLYAYNLTTETFSDEISLTMPLNSITAAEYNPEDGMLYVGDSKAKGIYTVNPATGQVELFIAADVHGGDIAVMNGQDVYLATQNGNNLYSFDEGNTYYVANLPSKVTGAAMALQSQTILVSTYQSTVFTKISTYSNTVIAAYEVTEFGLPFILGYGDLASGCSEYNNETRPELPSRTHAIHRVAERAIHRVADKAIHHVADPTNHFTTQPKSILSCSPNPTSGQSKVVLIPAKTGHTLVEVYDMNGRNVATLFNQQAREGEQYQLDFDGSFLPNGVYIYRLTTQNETTITKFMIAK